MSDQPDVMGAYVPVPDDDRYPIRTDRARCPNCGEQDEFISPKGSIETLCMSCGWASDEEERDG